MRERAATVYNFEVENTHTYFVGNSDLWVHNVCFRPIRTFWEHVIYGEGIRGSQLLGGHSLDAFDTWKLGGWVKEVSRTKIHEGVYKIEYRAATLDIAGNPVKDAAGKIIYKAKIEPKNVFDPQIIPVDEFKKTMLKAAEDGFKRGDYNGNLLNGQAPNGMKFQFRTDQTITSNATNLTLKTAYISG